MILILIGPQGSGKGTQSQLISEKLGLFRVVPGDIMRKAAKNNPKIRKIIESGKLVDDTTTLALIKEYLNHNSQELNDLIFDGFPRRLSQYRILKTWLDSENNKIDFLISLKIPKEVTLKRLSTRRVCSTCGKVYNLITDPPKKSDLCSCGGNLVVRKDDRPEAIEKRLSLYENETRLVIDEALKDGVLVEIDGTQEIDKITNEIIKTISK